MNKNAFNLLTSDIKETENNIKLSSDKIKTLRNNNLSSIKEILSEISKFESPEENEDDLGALITRYKMINKKDRQLSTVFNNLNNLMSEINEIDNTVVGNINQIKSGIDTISEEHSKNELLSKYEKLVEVYEGFFNIPWVINTSEYINQLIDYSESLQSDFQDHLSEIRDVLYEKVEGFNE